MTLIYISWTKWINKDNIILLLHHQNEWKKINYPFLLTIYFNFYPTPSYKLLPPLNKYIKVPHFSKPKGPHGKSFMTYHDFYQILQLVKKCWKINKWKKKQSLRCTSNLMLKTREVNIFFWNILTKSKTFFFRPM